MTGCKTYHADEFFAPDFHFALRRVVNCKSEFNLQSRFRREFWKISFIVSGQGEVLINDRAYPVAPGTGYLVHPRAETTYNMRGESLELYNILFDRVFLGAELKTLQDDLEFFKIFSDSFSHKINPLIYIQSFDLRLRTIIKDMEREYQRRDANYRIYLKLKLIELLILMQRGGVKKLRRVNRDELIRYIDHLLENDFDHAITLKYLAAKVSLTPNHLCTLYHQGTNSSIVQKLKSIRLQRAAMMLAEKKRSISEICYACGFNDLGYFYRAFGAAYGCNPGCYRKKFG